MTLIRFITACVLLTLMAPVSAGTESSPPGGKLLMQSSSRPSIQHQSNGRGLQMTLEISGEKSRSSQAPSGARFITGLAGARMILGGPQSNAVRDWMLYE